MYALIMAGGSGTRLWPVSRQHQPKQLLKFIGDQTLLQTTYKRLRKFFSDDNIYIATVSGYQKAISTQLPKIPNQNYSIETAIKDRGPAIALATLLMHKRDPSSTFVTAWSDHYIKNEAAYFKILNLGEKFLKSYPDYFLTVGVKPSYPHTGFGYIECGKTLGKGVVKVKSFKEKPDLKTAKKFLAAEKYLWNTGYFICKTSTLLNLYKKYLPEIFSLLEKIQPFVGTAKQQSAINKFYPLMPKVDIEKGLIENLSKIAVLPATFDWADIGSWSIIKDVLSKKDDNLHHGLVESINSKNTLVYNHEDKLVATVGVDDLIIVNTEDALLVANKHHSEAIKDLVKRLKENKKLNRYL